MIKSNLSTIQGLAIEAEKLIAALKKHIESDAAAKIHFNVETPPAADGCFGAGSSPTLESDTGTNKSPYELHVSLHGIHILFRVELSLNKDGGEGNVCAFILSHGLSGKLVETHTIPKLPFPNLEESKRQAKLSNVPKEHEPAWLEAERESFAKTILSRVSEALATAGSLKLQ